MLEDGCLAESARCNIFILCGFLHFVLLFEYTLFVLMDNRNLEDRINSIYDLVELLNPSDDEAGDESETDEADSETERMNQKQRRS
jgi:hypothetical protein